MVNLLGDIWPSTDEAPAWLAALAQSQLKMHLYGKQAARAGRKMGHYTVLSANRDEAIKLAMQVRAELNIGT
jgi:5-(carboxyamino)imidazole ribonucleotide synthase